MKLINLITRALGRPVTLALLGLIAFSAAAEAARIKMECRVAGYSTAGWIEIRPGSNTGGAVRKDAAGYYTDRVKRGEPLLVTFYPSVSSEYCQTGAIAGAFWDGGSTAIGSSWLAFSKSGVVPLNVNVDNVYVWVYTGAGYFEKRIPIGSR